MAIQSDLLVNDGVVTLASWELRMLRDLAGEKADALFAAHERSGNEQQLDEALEFVALFNKLNFNARTSEKTSQSIARNELTSQRAGKLHKQPFSDE